jgi:hypothetical protein
VSGDVIGEVDMIFTGGAFYCLGPITILRE